MNKPLESLAGVAHPEAEMKGLVLSRSWLCRNYGGLLTLVYDFFYYKNQLLRTVFALGILCRSKELRELMLVGK
jgi:hypothetical protein